MVMVWILMGLALFILKGGFGGRWIGEQGHRWKWLNTV